MPRILIVDDEIAILKLFWYSFRKAGYEVTTASSGEQALAICENKNFDAVLSDVTMTGIDGHQTVSRIRAGMPQVVSVLMSGFHMVCTGACCVPTRHCTWLQKPFSPEVAVATVEQSLATRSGVLVS
jgi:DNA-binding NtrC family response regulator